MFLMQVFMISDVQIYIVNSEHENINSKGVYIKKSDSDLVWLIQLKSI